MAKSKTLYVCSNCGFESSKWNGRCQNCGEWITFEETQAVSSSKVVSGFSQQSRSLVEKIATLSEIDVDSDVRYYTGVSELDRVLGGGLVKGR